MRKELPMSQSPNHTKVVTTTVTTMSSLTSTPIQAFAPPLRLSPPTSDQYLLPPHLANSPHFGSRASTNGSFSNNVSSSSEDKSLSTSNSSSSGGETPMSRTSQYKKVNNIFLIININEMLSDKKKCKGGNSK